MKEEAPMDDGFFSSHATKEQMVKSEKEEENKTETHGIVRIKTKFQNKWPKWLSTVDIY